MNAADALTGLLEATLATGVVLIVILALRGLLRRRFGAGVAYHVWALLPVALIATWLPTPQVTLPVLAMLPVRATAAQLATLAHVPDHRPWLLMLWLAGAISTATLLWRRQRQFVRDLGATTPTADGELKAQHATAGLPAAFGVLRPRIVLPADFNLRYTPEQQALMRCHERSHIGHGDLYANAAFALLRCAFWFNPLLHWAARAFRHDQELACDQRVIARHPHARRAYGEAMLKTQLAVQPLPLACHWGYGHPLKERIEMLKQPLPSLPRWIGGSLVVCTLAAATAFTAWAAQPADRTSNDHPARSAAASSTGSDAPATDGTLPHVPAPSYPQDALDQRIGGQVVLLVDIDAAGVPTAVEVERAEPAGVFDAAAIEAAKQWRFTPDMDNGRAIAGRVRVPVCFDPKGPAGCPR
jgi:TonB family protein